MTYPEFMIALALFREASNQPTATREAIASVIRNRGRMAPAQGFKSDPVGNVTKTWAFTSMTNNGDPNLIRWPHQDDPVWLDCCRIAQDFDGLKDSTGGAVFYFSPPLKVPPSVWGPVIQTAQVGSLKFYKVAA